MNFDAVISLLLRSDWLFLALCIAALAGATVASFGRIAPRVPSWKSGSLASRRTSEMNPPFRA